MRLPGIGRAAPGALLNLVQPEHITKLYRSYCQGGAAAAVTRHRGKSPRQAAFFFKNPEVSFHAAQLASLYLIYGLVSAAGGGLESRYRVGSLESGTLLCEAYEAYLELHAPVSISFEHAWFLLLRAATSWVWPAARTAAVCACAICWPDTSSPAAIASRGRLCCRTEAVRGRTGLLVGWSCDRLVQRPRSNAPKKSEIMLRENSIACLVSRRAWSTVQWSGDWRGDSDELGDAVIPEIANPHVAGRVNRKRERLQ